MGDQQEEQKNLGDAPSHLNFFSIRAKGYQSYLSNLKGGGKSGISENFGCAETLFATTIDTPPVEILDTAGLAPTEEELPARANLFADKVFEECYEYAMGFTQKAGKGEFGPEVKKANKKGIPLDQLAGAVKELSCVFAYLAAIEQQILDADEPTWQQEVFGNIMVCLDKLLPDPTCDRVLGKYGNVDAEMLCLKAATGFSQLLGISDLGDLGWVATHEYLVRSHTNRTKWLKQALESPVEVKASE